MKLLRLPKEKLMEALGKDNSSLHSLKKMALMRALELKKKVRAKEKTKDGKLKEECVLMVAQIVNHPNNPEIQIVTEEKIARTTSPGMDKLHYRRVRQQTTLLFEKMEKEIGNEVNDEVEPETNKDKNMPYNLAGVAFLPSVSQIGKEKV